MTAEPGVLLGIQTADCIPVLVADRRRLAVAAFHAGWRGTVKRIVENGIGRMRMEFGSRPEDLVAAIGPGIGACCYAVGEEVLSEFESQFNYGAELFREVYDTDPVRTKYPMLFMTQRAPGHSPTGARTTSGPGGGEPEATTCRGAGGRCHRGCGSVHELPSGDVLLAPGVAGAVRTDDERGGSRGTGAAPLVILGVASCARGG